MTDKKQHTTIQHEAPVSATVKLVSESGGDILLTVRSGSSASQVEAVLDNLAGALKYAKDKYHLAPKPNGGPSLSATNGSQAAAPAAGQPAEGWCPVHSVQMKWRTGSGGDGWWSHKAQDPGGGEFWCRGK